MNNTHETLTMKGVMKRYGIKSRRTLYNLIKGGLPVHQLTPRIRYCKLDELLKWEKEYEKENRKTTVN